MTAIVGFTKDNTVYLAGDTLGSNSNLKSEYTESKVFKNGSFIFGYTDTFRFGEILEYNFVPPEHTKGVSDKAFLVKDFIPKLRNVLEECKYVKAEDKAGNGTFLMGYRGKLYKVQSDWSILEPTCGYTAVGSGDEICIGAISALKDIEEFTPKEKVIKAIEIASKHNPYVGGKITVKSLKYKKGET